MRENVIFVYPKSPGNFDKYLKNVNKYDSFDYMNVKMKNKDYYLDKKEDEDEVNEVTKEMLEMETNNEE